MAGEPRRTPGTPRVADRHDRGQAGDGAMSKDEALSERLLAIFRVEGREHLQAMATHLLALRPEATATETHAALEGLFRATHTLKGAARSIGLETIEAPCQAAESLINRLVRGELELTPPLLGLIQDAVAHVAHALSGTKDGVAAAVLVERLENAATGTAVPTDRQPRSPMPPVVDFVAAPPTLPSEGTIRVSTALLDKLLVRAEQLSVAKLAVTDASARLGALVDALGLARKASDRATGLCAAEGTAQALFAHVRQEAQALSRVADGLQQDLRQIRMTKAATQFDLLPLMVRDLCREQNKDVELSIDGTDLELDRRVLEAIKDPLIHLVRNAIDHGIEAADVRVAAGKPPRGRLSLSLVEREGGRVEIRLADDGSGVDLDKVKAAAMRARLVRDEDAADLADDKALDLIFRSGLSTSPIITRVSGRGLGMSIVRERIERLGGTVRLESEAGRGTTVTILLAATVTAFRGLLVRDADRFLLIPLDAVERTWRVASDDILSVQARPNVLLDGDLLPFARLRALLNPAEGDDLPAPGTRAACVAVRSGEQRVAIGVDEIEGERELLAKELQPPLVRVRHVAGAGILGTGEVVMILRPADLVRSAAAGGRRPSPTKATRRQPVVLIVDDSITTRAVERNILEAAGFAVRVAADGIEAWQMLTQEAFDLVVSDVDMPRMDGFALTEQIRGHPEFKDLPVVLVTALETRDDKEKGIRLGANAYVFKSSFAESNLLEIIRRLI